MKVTEEQKAHAARLRRVYTYQMLWAFLSFAAAVLCIFAIYSIMFGNARLAAPFGFFAAALALIAHLVLWLERLSRR